MAFEPRALGGESHDVGCGKGDGRWAARREQGSQGASGRGGERRYPPRAIPERFRAPLGESCASRGHVPGRHSFRQEGHEIVQEWLAAGSVVLRLARSLPEILVRAEQPSDRLLYRIPHHVTPHPKRGARKPCRTTP